MMFRHIARLVVAIAAFAGAVDARAQELSASSFHLATPSLGVRDGQLPLGVDAPRAVGLHRHAATPRSGIPIDYNARLGIGAAADDRHIERFLLIGAAAGGLLGYAVYRRYDPDRDPYVRTLALVSGMTVGVTVGAVAYFIGPRQPSDREPPTPQPPY